MTFLPEKDCLYLENRNLNFEEIVEGDRVGIILRQFNLPIGSFDVASADVLIFLPKGYPDIPPDMFHLIPWVKLASRLNYPRCADQSVTFKGLSWQRWSRHNSDWRVGIDGINTMIKRIEHALEVAT
jgi:hypothetical protein